ncbi:hypothetical protein ISP17_02720 [Dyella ginsengisoli]|uniref:Uncharacterized protein n=2 Tax=Dyella ginsengisoli TaxID=363848 RepID=A0ABW8JP18_9GAMM
MKRCRRLRPTIRRRLTWAMVLWLVCQQLALAAYACAGLPGGALPAEVAAMPMMAGRQAAGMRMPGMAMPDTGMAPDCADMRTGAPARALCEGHCHPDHATQPDARAPSVPTAMVGMLAPPPVMPAMAQVSSSGNVRVRAERWRPPAPPPMLLYCSLLI